MFLCSPEHCGSPVEINKYILGTWWKLVGWKLCFIYLYSIFKLTTIYCTLSLNFLTKSRLLDWLVKALNVPWLEGKYYKADLKTQNLRQILYLSVLLGTLWFLMELDNVLRVHVSLRWENMWKAKDSINCTWDGNGMDEIDTEYKWCTDQKNSSFWHHISFNLRVINYPTE